MRKQENDSALSFVLLVLAFFLCGASVKACEEDYRDPETPESNDVIDLLKDYNRQVYNGD